MSVCAHACPGVLALEAQEACIFLFPLLCSVNTLEEQNALDSDWSQNDKTLEADLNASYSLELSPADPRQAKQSQSWTIDIQGENKYLLFSDTTILGRFVTQHYCGNSWLIYLQPGYLKLPCYYVSLLLHGLPAMYRASPNSLPWHSESIPSQSGCQPFCKTFSNWIGSFPLGFQSGLTICYHCSLHTGYH